MPQLRLVCAESTYLVDFPAYYSNWIFWLNFIRLDLSTLPTDCTFDTYQSFLLVVGLTPLLLIACVPLVLMGVHVIKAMRARTHVKLRAAALRGLVVGLQVGLLITYILAAPLSSAFFKVASPFGWPF